MSYLVQDSDSNVMLVVVLHEFLLIQILLSSGGVKAELCEILVWWFKACCDWRHKAFATRFGRTTENGFKAFYTFKGRHLLAKPWYWAHDQTVSQTSCQRKWAGDFEIWDFDKSMCLFLWCHPVLVSHLKIWYGDTERMSWNQQFVPLSSNKNWCHQNNLKDAIITTELQLKISTRNAP